MLSTLGDDWTTSCIAVGWALEFEDWSTPIGALHGLLRAAAGLERRWTAYVPGDTATDAPVDFSGRIVFGRAVVSTQADDLAPTPVSLKAVREALDALAPLSGPEWATLKAAAPDLKGDAPPAPGAWLLSWGPLCYGAIYVGRALAAADEGKALYKLTANQDMEQMWGPGRVDGLRALSVEFGDVEQLDPSPAWEAKQRARVPKIEAPGFFLNCRYD